MFCPCLCKNVDRRCADMLGHVCLFANILDQVAHWPVCLLFTQIALTSVLFIHKCLTGGVLTCFGMFVFSL